jgi:hypothetical protein
MYVLWDLSKAVDSVYRPALWFKPRERKGGGKESRDRRAIIGAKFEVGTGRCAARVGSVIATHL